MLFPHFKPHFHTHGGAIVPHQKNTEDLHSVTMDPPETVILPMVQHIGAPCKPLVCVGESVKIGQLIASSENNFSAPIHASVSGEVFKIEKILMPDGSKIYAIFIKSDGKMTPSDKLAPLTLKNKLDLVNAAKNSGLVGLGGAGFPTHIKLNIPKNKIVDTLIINAAECEPYITSDSRAIIEETAGVLAGIRLVQALLGIDRAIIGIENNKPAAIQTLKQELDKNTPISVFILKSKYPQGAEKVLIKAITGREVPVGKLPVDAGCLVMNVSTILQLFKYTQTGMPLVSKRITVDGSAIREPKNLIVPIGTPIFEVIKFCGGYKTKPKKILMGGPMMGIALIDDQLPILKQNNAILALDSTDAEFSTPSSCIRCGRCIQSCPMHLLPVMLEKNVEKRNLPELDRLDISSCMECGCCAYNCPAFRPLVQSIRLGKHLLKEMRSHQ